MEKKKVTKKNLIAIEAPLMDRLNLAVKATNISKNYRMYSGSKEKLLDLVLPTNIGKEFKALKNISFEVEKGEIVGLLGLNGAGKSTLSNILGGVSIPSEGKIELNGESAVIAIGLGLNNFLTGIENIELKATMMGYKKEEINKIIEDVIDFAEIGNFIHQPIRTYSSGMKSRLGFGIAVNMSPDILVIDEALSVGDPTFTGKCLKKMNEFKESGKTIFFVSHSIPQVKEFCTKAIWLEYGMLKEYGEISEVATKYEEYIKKINAMTDKEKRKYKESVLKEQDHGLLEQYDYKSLNLKELDYSGKIIKKVVLSKDGILKKYPMNFDFKVLIFSFFPLLYRKDFSSGLLLLASQGVNLFIMKWPVSIGLYFILNLGFSVVAAKRRIKDLVLEKNYIIEEFSAFEMKELEDDKARKEAREFRQNLIVENHQKEVKERINERKNKELELEKEILKEIAQDREEIIEENQENLIDKNLNKKIKRKRKKNSTRIEKRKRKKKIILLSSLIIVSTIVGITIYNSNLNRKIKIPKNKIPEIVVPEEEQREIAELDFNKFIQILVRENSEGEKWIDSLALFERDLEGNIKMNIYPGDFLVKGNEVNEISRMLNYQEINEVKEVLKNNFNYDCTNYIISKLPKDEKIQWSKDFYDKEVVEFKKNGLSREKFERALGKSFEFSELEKKLENNQGEISVAYAEYKEKLLVDFCKEKNINIPKDFLEMDYKFIYNNEELIEQSKIIKELLNQ